MLYSFYRIVSLPPKEHYSFHMDVLDKDVAYKDVAYKDVAYKEVVRMSA